MSFNPKSSFHLCPDFSIPPPPQGHLELGTILHTLDINSILSPLNINDTIPIAESHLRPTDGPSEKTGFTRSLRDLRGVEGSIWANIFGDGLGARFSGLKNRENDETLTVEKLSVRYFIPTEEYMKKSLESDGVAFYINDTKRKSPVYMITGLMWTQGAKITKVHSRKNNVSGQVAGTEPNTAITAGTKMGYENEETESAGFAGSTDFILGIRVRKIWWDKKGVRKTVTDVVGATLGDAESKGEGILDGLEFDDNVKGENIVEDVTGDELFVTWILPEDD